MVVVLESLLFIFLNIYVVLGTDYRKIYHNTRLYQKPVLLFSRGEKKGFKDFIKFYKNVFVAYCKILV